MADNVNNSLYLNRDRKFIFVVRKQNKSMLARIMAVLNMQMYC